MVEDKWDGRSQGAGFAGVVVVVVGGPVVLLSSSMVQCD